MKTAPAPGYVLTLLLVLCFTMATWLQPLAANQPQETAQSQNLLNVTMGGAERLFAGLFFRQADIYFHSGYYPSIFSSARTNEMHIAEQATADNHGPQEEEKEMDFLGPPLDWIEALGRNSINTVHTHLDEMGTDKVGEILPWLRISAELDPQQVGTYTVGAFWLRKMGKVGDAQQFLREGLRANPQSCELEYELGRIFEDEKNDPQRAANLFSLALGNWERHEAVKDDPDYTLLDKIASHLALQEEKQGDYTNALAHMEIWKSKAPFPDEVQKRIDELKERIAQKTTGR